MSRRLLIVVAIAAAALAVVTAAVAVTTMPLTVTPKTPSTVTLSWPAQIGVDGYDFVLDGVFVSTSTNRALTSTTARKSSTYEVVGWKKERIVSGAYPPPAPPSNVVQLSGTVSPAQVNGAVAGTEPATVRGPFTVNGNLELTRPNLTVDRATVNGYLQFNGSANRSAFVNGSARALRVYADDVLVEGNVFDNGGRVPNPQSDAVGATNLTVRGNRFLNFYGRDPQTHSEALFWGAGSTGLIEGNTFTNNGNTGHVFFTWWPTYGDWPRNVCVRGNTFGPTAGAHFAIDSRTEIPASANIRIDPSQQSEKALSAGNRFLASC